MACSWAERGGFADMRRGPSGPLLSSSCSALGRALVRLTPVETALCRTLQRFRYLSLLGEDFRWIVHSPSRLATPGWGANQGACAPRQPPSCRLPQRAEGRPHPMPRSIVPRPCWGERRRLTIHHGSYIGGAPFIVEAERTTTQRPPSRQLWKSAGSPGRGHARGRDPARARCRRAVWRDHGGQDGSAPRGAGAVVAARRRGRGPRSGRDRGIGAGSRQLRLEPSAPRACVTQERMHHQCSAAAPPHPTRGGPEDGATPHARARVGDAHRRCRASR
jgi:hypothetical protein